MFPKDEDEDDDRLYMECDTCNYACSGNFHFGGLYPRADAHERENPGHRVREVD